MKTVHKLNYVPTKTCRRCGDCCRAETLLKECSPEEIMILKMICLETGRKFDPKAKCPFLEFKLGNAICKIYDKRPWFCRDYFCSKC